MEAGQHLSLGRWVLLCAAAEAIGMTAAAGSARLSQAFFGDGTGLHSGVVLLVILGGLVEGFALGILQSSGLVRWLPGLNRLAWIVATAVVAGVGWALASLPSQLATTASDESPPLWIILVGSLALGVGMGALLGVAQAFTLTNTVRHPWRWVGISVASWPLAMAIIFLGATAPDSTWPTAPVIALGTVTGAAAGASLGLVSGVLLPLVEGASPANRVVLGILGSGAHGILNHSVLGLRLRGRRTGHIVELPVQFAAGPDGLVVFPSHGKRKSWWRNLEQPSIVDVLHDGHWMPAIASLSRQGDADRANAARVYTERYPKVAIPRDAPLVVMRLARS